jgi:hypothetical protein
MYSKLQRHSTLTSQVTVLIAIMISFIWWLNTRYVPFAIAAQLSVIIFFLIQKRKENSDNIQIKIWLSIAVFLTNLALILFFHKKWY